MEGESSGGRGGRKREAAEGESAPLKRGLGVVDWLAQAEGRPLGGLGFLDWLARCVWKLKGAF